VTIQGPFASGTTFVQLQFAVQYGGPERSFEQTFPIPLQRIIVGVEQLAELTMSSPQFATVTPLPTENGTYLLGQGAALQAGTPLAITLSNLPAHSRTPRYVAIALALALAAFGTWMAVTPRSTAVEERRALVARRDRLLADLATLESRHRAGTVDPGRFETRRRKVVAELEQIYGELDETSAGPHGGDEGVAA
jgi:hypothetical protein